MKTCNGSTRCCVHRPTRGALAALFLLCAAAAPAEPPAAPPQPAPERPARPKERDEYAEQASQLREQGKLAEAAAAAEKALAIARELRGPGHEEVADSLERLAEIREEQDDLAAARTAREEVLAIQQKLHEPGHWHVLDASRALADLGLLAKLSPEDRRERKRAVLLLRQAAQLEHEGRPRDALTPAKEAAEILKRLLGEQHPDYAMGLNELAHLHADQGDYAEAEPLYRQALETRKRVLGEQHPLYAVSLIDLAHLYAAQGDQVQAEMLCRQALLIRKRALGELHPDYAASLTNLADVYRAQGDPAGAEPLYRQALAIIRRTLGEENCLYAGTLNNLANLRREQGDDAGAESLYRRALEITRRTDGEQHPNYATSLGNLALILRNQGDYVQAEALCRQELEIRKRAQGELHPDYAATLGNLARTREDLGDLAQAEALYRQALEITRRRLDLTSVVQSERQQLVTSAESLRYLDAYLSITAQVGTPAAETYALMLPWKGAIYRRQHRARLLRAGGDEDVTRLVRELEATAHRLASVAFASPLSLHPDDRVRQLAELTEQKERLEADLGRRSAAFRQEQAEQQLTPAQLQALLPADSALVDFLGYFHGSSDREQRGQRRCERRLLAFVVRPESLVRLDLGPADPIADEIEQWRMRLEPAWDGLRLNARPGTLRRLLWEPLEAHLAGVHTVLISPDGPLASFPFAALPGQVPGLYLLEERALAIVPVPQMLPELFAARPKGSSVEPSLLAVGDVNYDWAEDPPSPTPTPVSPQSAFGPPARADLPAAALHPRSWRSFKTELDYVESAFRRAFPDGVIHILSDQRATERAVRELAPRHRYLHLYTHGFFAPQEALPGLAEFHPGLLSGIVLAGANQPSRPDQDDGILTAVDVAELDLTQVDLAVLSACETGLGTVGAAEGLLGLQRAFQTAGARVVVASLWRVPDVATTRLMKRFCENLWERKMSNLEALRAAQLAMLKGELEPPTKPDPRSPARQGLPPPPVRRSPEDWAAWVLSGDPR